LICISLPPSGPGLSISLNPFGPGLLQTVKGFAPTKLQCSFIVLVLIKNTIMKTSILTIAIAAFFVACNPKPAVETVSVKQNTTDTSGLSEFQQWKNQKDLIAEQTASFTTDAVVDDNITKPTVIYRTAPVKQVRTASKVSKSSTTKRRPAVSRPDANIPNPNSGTGTSETAGVGTGESGGAGTSLPSEAPVPAKKEGWSKAAKGTAIGGASGAVLGAIISKDNKGKGAVIGAVIGAAGGYVLGRAQDKKDGRVNYNK
jgi:hypothetical protein